MEARAATDGGKSDAAKSDGKSDAGGSSGSGGSSGAGGIGGAGGSGGASGAGGTAGNLGGGGNPDGGGGSSPDGGGGSKVDSGVDADAGNTDAAHDLHVTIDVTDSAVDAGPPPSAVTNLTATVLDRRATSFHLSWTAPAASAGGPVADYAVRVATVPITSANFDGPGALTIIYPNFPAAVGATDGVDATNLYIETGYYFAVAGVDIAGQRGPIVSTPTTVTAHFNVTILNGQNATDNIGYFSDGTGDFGASAGRTFTGDNLSDLLVGNLLAKNCYLYFGTPTGYSTTPSVTFTSNAGWYGASVANIGDIDGDGLADIAISSPQDGNGKVFIFSRKNPPASWGTTTTWPATLADTQANYVITGDAASSGKFFGTPTAPVGDFDGDGIADFAISALTYGTGGRVVIVKGSSTFSSVSFPDATKTIVLDGTAAGGQFGSAVLGVGPTSTANATLLTSAPPVGTLYAFGGAPSATPVLASSATDSVVYAPATGGYGYTFGFLGALGTSSFGFAVTANIDQVVDIHLGTTATGPFTGPAGGVPAPSLRITGPGGNSWGAVNIGGGVPATTRHVSFIGGDTVPDLALSGQGDGNGPTVYIIDGTVLRTATGTLAVSATVPAKGVVMVPGLPADWAGHGFKSTVVPDVNGDNYGDFAIGEVTTAKAGRVAVFY